MKIFNLALIMVIVAMIIGGVWYWQKTENTIAQLSNENKALQNSVDVLKGELSVLQGKYDIEVSKRYDINLNNPTYEQVKSILKELEGVKIEGNCLDKSKYVQDYSYNKGIQCYIVISNFKDLKGHATVAFYTDKGWVYVEPDGMIENKMAQGKPYYIHMKVIGLPFSILISPSTEDNTVSQMVVFR